jgi:hypothetical protein
VTAARIAARGEDGQSICYASNERPTAALLRE